MNRSLHFDVGLTFNKPKPLRHDALRLVLDEHPPTVQRHAALASVSAKVEQALDGEKW